MTTTADTAELRALLATVQPACEARCAHCGERCPTPAAWIGTLTDRGRVLVRILHCDDDKQACEATFRECQFSRDGIEYRAEALR